MKTPKSMKTIFRISAIFTVASILTACGEPPALAPHCPEHTDFSPCSDPVTGKLTGEATCYEAPSPDVAPEKLVPVVGCALPQYNIVECIESCGAK